jgi:prepilin-type processing-associated H-X9-DG protein
MASSDRRPPDVTFAEIGALVIIVSVLAWMTAPALTRARSQARQATCLANVKAITRALQMYLADNDASFPQREVDPQVVEYFNTYPGGGGSGQWDPRRSFNCHRAKQANPYLRYPVILEAYLPSRQIWQCPSARLQGGAFFINGGGANWLARLQEHKGEWGKGTDPYLCPIPSWPAGWGGEVTDSILQQRLAVPIGGKGRSASREMFVQSIGVSAGTLAALSVLSVGDPGNFVVCADAGATFDDFCTGTLAYPDLCHLECAGPGDWEADWERCPWSRQCGAIGAMKIDPGLRTPYARHFGGVNVGFLDGHAQWLASETIIAESPSHGNPGRGYLRGFMPWGPTADAPWYDPEAGVPALY